MKKTVIAAAVLCLTAGTPTYSFAADPCEVVLCMYGKATGNSGGSECSSPERTFFNIVKKKKSSIRWNKTFDARKSFLNQCSSADPAAISKIMSKFGKVRG